MPLFRRAGRPTPTEEDHRLLRGALGKLDPWTFWSVPLDDPEADYACLTRAVAGSSRTIRGVRVARLEDLPSEIGGRERALDPSTARRAAEAIGSVLPNASGPRPNLED